MLINSYSFGKMVGLSTAVLKQNTSNLHINNAVANNINQKMVVNAGSMLITITNWSMLNGNGPTSIVSCNVQGGHPSKVKSVSGTTSGGVSNGKTFVSIASSDVYTISRDVLVTVKISDASLPNIRAQIVILEVGNLQNVAPSAADIFSTNTGTVNLGNNKLNVFITGVTQQNTFIVASVSQLHANGSSLTGATYPAIGFQAIDYSTQDASQNVHSMINYMISSSNAGTIVSDWGSATQSAPWAATIVAFKTT